MRTKLTYESSNGKEIFVPFQYNYLLQSLIYNTFSPILAKKLHDEGFAYEGRKFKLFTFSRILGKGIKDNNKLAFKNGISFYFSSPKNEIVVDLASEGIQKMAFRLLGQEIFLSEIEILKEPVLKPKLLIKMLSPLTIYSTLKTEDGRKKVYYYRPNDKDFSNLIEQNAIKKYYVVYGEAQETLSLSIKPYRFSVKENLSVIVFRGTPIEAYTGIFELSGTEKLVKTVYDTGLGGKNSGGMGMWEIWKGGEKNA
jgi:CRISPR-associated endoribonuclease Cas6